MFWGREMFLPFLSLPSERHRQWMNEQWRMIIVSDEKDGKRQTKNENLFTLNRPQNGFEMARKCTKRIEKYILIDSFRWIVSFGHLRITRSIFGICYLEMLSMLINRYHWMVLFSLFLLRLPMDRNVIIVYRPSQNNVFGWFHFGARVQISSMCMCANAKMCVCAPVTNEIIQMFVS